MNPLEPILKRLDEEINALLHTKGVVWIYNVNDIDMVLFNLTKNDVNEILKILAMNKNSKLSVNWKDILKRLEHGEHASIFLSFLSLGQLKKILLLIYGNDNRSDKKRKLKRIIEKLDELGE
ncbi:MAG: hypothetical protein MRT15_12115 [archaeon YNP-LCB-003-016]|uniref:hypothetical protein n=1 Tax=Candidatus Culexarchaeum yellowstonense TaxID=2928963 RepID=UPI0026F0423B|nr:hypothetical protein [Candidatus Culexarchaeum yellowstonense]MCR6693131.1 hypothetical protein [Candidatus Culexarchaeum yellowstonense]